MARLDNPFALLDDDDAGDDLSALVAKAEAKISPPPTAVTEQPKPKAAPPGAFPSRPLPPSQYAREERGRERGGRGRGTGRSGYGSGGADDDGRGRYGNGYSRGYGYDSNGRGQGGRGGRGRGRGRGFYEEQGPLDNQGQSGDALNERHEVISPPKYENGKFGEESNGQGRWEERGYGYGYGYGGDYRRYRDGEGHGGRGYYGGENRSFRGGEGRRYGPRDGAGRRNGGYGYENKGEPFGEKEKAGEVAGIVETENVGAAGDNASSGREVSEITDAPKDVEPGQSNPQPVDSEDAAGKKTPEQLEEEEEAKKMTLAEYEKLVQEKRKALEAYKSEERKVVVDKQFDGMQVVEKKKEDELSLKLKSEKDKKKKDVLEKEEKTRKSVTINEFLKPSAGGNYRGPGRGRGGYRGGYSGRGRRAFVPNIDDAAHFPALGQNTATKADPAAKA